MFCRRVWQSVGPLARRLFSPSSRSTVPVRHMAFGIPGGSTNITYFVLCGGGLTAAVVYAYKTVSGDADRYEDRLVNMNSQAKVEEAPEAAAPAAEPAPEEPAAEILESVPAEPVAETSAEPVDEAASEEAAAVASEVVVTEASAEPEVSEEAAPVVLEEAAPEVTAEAPASEGADLLTAVKILASSPGEIAAASVGEQSLVEVEHQKGNDGSSTVSIQEVLGSEALEAAPETDIKKEAAVVNNEDRSEDVQNPAAEEVTQVSPAPAAVQEEEEGSFSPMGASMVDEADGEDKPEVALEETVSSTETTNDNASPSEGAEKVTDTADTSSEEQTPAEEISAEETPGTAEATQLAAASAGPDLEVLSPAEPEPPAPEALALEGESCHSCHSALSAGEDLSPPAALGEDLLTKEDMDPAHEARVETSLLM